MIWFALLCTLDLSMPRFTPHMFLIPPFFNRVVLLGQAFGGMFVFPAEPNVGSRTNPVTGAPTCPPGYTFYQVASFAYPDAPYHNSGTGIAACFNIPSNSVYTTVVGGMYQTSDAG
jgi:hypothetical protein